MSWFTAICSFYDVILWSTWTLVTDWIGPMDKNGSRLPPHVFTQQKAVEGTYTSYLIDPV